MKKIQRQKCLIYEKEQREMVHCTFAPKLNKKAKIRKPEPSILVQYSTTVVSARKGMRVKKQEKDKNENRKSIADLNVTLKVDTTNFKEPSNISYNPKNHNNNNDEKLAG